MVAIGVNDDGYREVIGAAEGFTESAECWREFPLVAEVARAARGQDVHRRQGRRHGRSIAEVFPNAAYQRCTVHFYRNALAKVPKSKRPKAAAMLKAIHAMESREASEAKALEVADELDSMRLKEAAKVVRDGYAETPDVHALPARALAAHTHQQRHRAPEPRDPQAHARGRDVPRREERPHARDPRGSSTWPRASGARGAIWT